MRRTVVIIAIIVTLLIPACGRVPERGFPSGQTGVPATPREQAIQAAIDQTGYTNRYDPSYVRIDYPGGNVPLDRGVC